MRAAWPVLLALLGACTTTDTEEECRGLQAGIVLGEPSLAIGRGVEKFVAATDGDTWTAAHGPQGGSHLWLSIRTTGLGPAVRLRYEFLELDGGMVARTQGSTSVCRAASGGQERTGITAFLPNDDSARDRLLCHGPFRFRVTASEADDGGKNAIDERVVGGVDGDPGAFVPFHVSCDGGFSDDDGGA